MDIVLTTEDLKRMGLSEGELIEKIELIDIMSYGIKADNMYRTIRLADHIYYEHEQTGERYYWKNRTTGKLGWVDVYRCSCS